MTGAEIASDIGPGLAKAAMAVVVDGAEWDLTRPIAADADVAIITERDEAALEIIRHDAAHVMAEAVRELYPDAQVTIGPAIENGFYYDFHRAEPFTPEDLDAIEQRMHEIVDRDEAITREVWTRDQAVAFTGTPMNRLRLSWSKRSRPMKRSAFTARAISSTFAAARICRRPSGSVTPSS